MGVRIIFHERYSIYKIKILADSTFFLCDRKILYCEVIKYTSKFRQFRFLAIYVVVQENTF